MLAKAFRTFLCLAARSVPVERIYFVTMHDSPFPVASPASPPLLISSMHPLAWHASEAGWLLPGDMLAIIGPRDAVPNPNADYADAALLAAPSDTTLSIDADTLVPADPRTSASHGDSSEASQARNAEKAPPAADASNIDTEAAPSFPETPRRLQNRLAQRRARDRRRTRLEAAERRNAELEAKLAETSAHHAAATGRLAAERDKALGRLYALELRHMRVLEILASPEANARRLHAPPEELASPPFPERS